MSVCILKTDFKRILQKSNNNKDKRGGGGSGQGDDPFKFAFPQNPPMTTCEKNKYRLCKKHFF